MVTFGEREGVALVLHEDEPFFLGLLRDGLDMGFELILLAGVVAFIEALAAAGSRLDAEGVIEGHGVVFGHLGSR